MIRKIAIPKFKDLVAPRFETASVILICTVAVGKVTDTTVIDIRGCEGFARARAVCDAGATVLICNGIKNFYRNLLDAEGVDVISGVELPIKQAIAEYAAGNISVREPVEVDASGIIPHDDLVCWARDLFESSGYRVRDVAESASFPIDMIAETVCPVCGRPVGVAVCCGAHIYRTDLEIQEFHHAEASDIHAKVFIYPSEETIKKYCSACGIQLIDPNLEDFGEEQTRISAIPLLKGPVRGHERAFARGD